MEKFAPKKIPKWKFNEGADISKSMQFYDHDGSKKDLYEFVIFFFAMGGNRDDAVVVSQATEKKTIQMQTMTNFNMDEKTSVGLANSADFPFELLDEEELKNAKKEMEDHFIACGGEIKEELIPRLFFRFAEIESE